MYTQFTHLPPFCDSVLTKGSQEHLTSEFAQTLLLHFSNEASQSSGNYLWQALSVVLVQVVKANLSSLDCGHAPSRGS